MADRPPPTVIPRTSRRARLPAFVRLPMLIILNTCVQSALWTAAENVLQPELGAVSKRPQPVLAEEGFGELTEPMVRLATKIALISVAWQLRYDCKMRRAFSSTRKNPLILLQSSTLAPSRPSSTSPSLSCSPPTSTSPTSLLSPTSPSKSSLSLCPLTSCAPSPTSTTLP